MCMCLFASVCVCMCVWDICVFVNHVRMLWTILCLFHAGQHWHGSKLVLSLYLDLLFHRPRLPSIPPMADMGLLSRLLFILLHDWNYTSLMNDRINLIHLDHRVWYVCCVWEIVSESVCMCVFVWFLFSSVATFTLWVKLILGCDFLAVDIHLDTHNWLGWLFSIHQLPLYSLELYLTCSYEEEIGIWSLGLCWRFLFSNQCAFYSWSVTAHLWVRIQDLLPGPTAGSPVQYEESPMCLLGVSQLSCMWGGRPRAWTVP